MNLRLIYFLSTIAFIPAVIIQYYCMFESGWFTIEIVHALMPPSWALVVFFLLLHAFDIKQILMVIPILVGAGAIYASQYVSNDYMPLFTISVTDFLMITAFFIHLKYMKEKMESPFEG